MQIDKFATPLIVAAQLLFAHRENAPHKALQRCIDYKKLGEDQAAEFWTKVVAEVIDALTSGVGGDCF